MKGIAKPKHWATGANEHGTIKDDTGGGEYE